MKGIVYKPREFEQIQLEQTPISFYTPITEREETTIPIVHLSEDAITSESEDSSPISFYMGYSNPTMITNQNQTQQYTKKIKGKTTYKTNDIDVGNLHELISKFEDAGISLRVTSGKRSGTTKQGNRSHHNTGDAIDITPGDGETYQTIKDKLRANPELVEWMKIQGWGILDETNPEMKQRTGATGDHWHIGKDKNAQSGLLTLLGRKGIKIPICQNGTTLENVDRKGNEALLKYKGTRQDPLTYDKWTSDPSDLERASFLLNLYNLKEGDYEAYDWLKSYVNSAGYDRIMKNQSTWWKSKHPYKKIIDFGKHLDGAKTLKRYVNEMSQPVIFNLDMHVDRSFALPYKRTAYIGTWKNNTNPYDFVTAHELAHLYHSPTAQYPTKLYPVMGSRANAEALQQNMNTKDGHDSKPDEKHSDILGLKYLLYKEGIYDSRSNKDATPEQIKTLREKYPNLRPLVQMDDEKAAWMINNVASNNKKVNLDNLS